MTQDNSVGSSGNVHEQALMYLRKPIWWKERRTISLLSFHRKLQLHRFFFGYVILKLPVIIEDIYTEKARDMFRNVGIEKKTKNTASLNPSLDRSTHGKHSRCQKISVKTRNTLKVEPECLSCNQQSCSLEVDISLAQNTWQGKKESIFERTFAKRKTDTEHSRTWQSRTAECGKSALVSAVDLA